MIFIVQFGINNLVQTFQRPQILIKVLDYKENKKEAFVGFWNK